MPSQPPRTNQLVQRNIKALMERRKVEERDLGWQDRVAYAVSRFAGSLNFVWVHLAVFGAWVIVNLGLGPGIPAFDPTFVGLATLASVEAIFISTFILITQNRMQAHADKRDELNLQVSLLAEHEITRLIKIVSEIGRRLEVPAAQHEEIEELGADVRPEDVLDTIDEHGKQASAV